MQSHRPRHTPHPPPPPIPTSHTHTHTRSPSASSTGSSTTSSNGAGRTVNSGFTVFPNSSTSTIRLVPATPVTPTQTNPNPNQNTSPYYSNNNNNPQSVSVHTSPAARTPGYFEPTLMNTPQQPEQQQQQYAIRRKRSATEPSPTSPPFSGGGIMAITQTAANGGGLGVPGEMLSAPVPIPLPPQPTSHPTPLATHPVGVPLPSASAPPTAKKESTTSKMKIFSKPTRIGTPGIDKVLRPPPSPNKISHISGPIPRLTPQGSVSNLVNARNIDDDRRSNFSSMVGAEIYSSSPPPPTGNTKPEKEHSHKPHFLRPRRDKDHTFSSSASNSKPVSADAPALYSFGPSSPSHIPKAIDITSVSSKNPLKKGLPISTDVDPPSLSFGDTQLTSDTAWPLLRSRIFLLFDGKPLHNTVEDLNKLVQIHIRRSVDRRSPVALLDDVRELFENGMRAIDPRLDELDDSRLVPRLVEAWMRVFGYTTPYLEAVFLPLQQEFKGCGAILSPRESREFFGVEVASLSASPMGLDVRRLVMIAFRDSVVLPLNSRLRILFSRLQMDFSVSQHEATEVVGKMLQCVSVLGAVLTGDEKQANVEELGRMLKHNWLSRGRTGRNRRGFVGTRVNLAGKVGV